MVSTFDAADADVSYEFGGFLYLRADNNEPVGYNWILELPSDPDPTVQITDGKQTFEFTGVEEVPTPANTTIETVLRAVERTEI